MREVSSSHYLALGSLSFWPENGKGTGFYLDLYQSGNFEQRIGTYSRNLVGINIETAAYFSVSKIIVDPTPNGVI